MRDRITLALALVLAVPLGSGIAAAAAPDLVVQLRDGQSYAYALDAVRCLEFAADSLCVRVASGDWCFAVADMVSLSYRWEPTGVVEPDQGAALTRIAHLLPSQPNPGSPETRIAFDLPRGGTVHLRIFGVDGRLVRSLVDEARTAGRHAVVWDGRDDAGRPAASGAYVYRLEAAGIDESRKLLLVR